MRPWTVLAPFFLALASCGGGSSDPAALNDAGYKALGAGDFDAAAQDFENALAAIGGDSGHAQYFKAKLGSIEAKCRTDAAGARDGLIALSKELPDKVEERHFSTIAGKLGGAGKFEEAIALLDAGKQAYPESTLLDTLGERLVEQAKKAGDSEALDALAGLGYAGD